MSDKSNKEKPKKGLKKGTGQQKDVHVVQKFPFSTGGLREDQISVAWEEYFLAHPTQTIEQHQVTVDSEGNEIVEAHAENDSAKQKANSKSDATNKGTRSTTGNAPVSTTGETETDAEKAAAQKQNEELQKEQIFSLECGDGSKQ